MAKLTQGTQLYFRDPVGPTVREVDCATAITGIEATRDQIETTCLAGASRTYEPGMPTPGQAQVTINFDPSQPSHVRLHELYRAGTKVEWAVGWSDGTAPPTLGTADDFELPTSRSWINWNGFVANVPFDFALNAVVGSTLPIQLSDFPVLTPKV